MKLVNENSLAATLDAVNEARLFGRLVPRDDRRRAAKWIARRQGRPGAYRGVMFAPTDAERQQGIALFTGEKVVSGGGAAHILGQEACRALILLDVPMPVVNDALERATEGIAAVLNKAAAGVRWQRAPGEFCCARCTCALWRHLAVGGLEQIDPAKWLDAGMGSLKAHRSDNGRWRRFPFYYTLLALSELAHPKARAELRYARPACKRVLDRQKPSAIGERRRALLEKVLGDSGAPIAIDIVDMRTKRV